MQSQPSNLRGFSLIELTVALLIITTLATIAVRSTNDLSFQVRYDQTKDQLEQIKQAIIGNPQRTVNGQPDISGFVADMGRLPGYLRDLLQPGACLNGGTVLPDTPLQCVDAGETWNWFDKPCTDNTSDNLTACQTAGAVWLGWNIDPTSRLGFGWRRPYLSVSGNPTNNDAIADGWGNTSAEGNYGWRYFNLGTPTTNIDDDVNLIIQSLGKDQALGGNDYDADYPINQPIIPSSDWQVDISNGISVQFQSPIIGGLCRQDITQNACYGNAAHWENCLFLTPNQCATTGGSWATDCRMTQTVCTNKGGTWNSSSNPQCVFDVTTCPAAGGTWSASDGLCVFNSNTCLTTVGGAVSRACILNSTTCSGAGKTWDATNHLCTYTSTQCLTDGGIFTASSSNASCLRTYRTPSSTNEQYNETSCLADGFNWYGSSSRSISICMRVYYRQNGAIISTYSTNPITIEENSMVRQLNFTGFSVLSIPNGINAIGIFEYDNSTSTCTNNIYPSDRQQAIPILFNARSNLPVINW